MMEKCGETLLLLEQFAAKGSALAVSDAGCGAALSKAAMQAAWLNVRINLRLIKDEEFAEDIDALGRNLLKKGSALADRIYADVEAKLE
jgi:formiminotetrahydrofolate cyclodeaminase